ncbi:MAG: MBL fold metallo-hydrolase [Hylemonella sp.]|jgi:phosphoribosyl 1,2-cyclic phosphodiesterase
MKVKFWGVRGSIPSPGPRTVRYGGNTTCIEVRTDNNELIILDAGTGIFPLSQTLLPELPLQANLLLTHTHWDHIQGLPFYMPNFIPGNILRLHGAFDPVSGKGVEQALTVQLQHSFFPVLEDQIRAGVEYVTLTSGTPIHIGSARVTPFQLNHPVINFGYRIECNGKSVFFTGDHEPPFNPCPAGDPKFEESQRLLERSEQAIIDAMQGVDVLIADSTFTDQEYPEKIGWGHGTLRSSMQIAHQAGAKVLYCTHHEPSRSDDDLEAAFAQALARHSGVRSNTDIRLAREGECYEF